MSARFTLTWTFAGALVGGAATWVIQGTLQDRGPAPADPVPEAASTVRAADPTCQAALDGAVSRLETARMAHATAERQQRELQPRFDAVFGAPQPFPADLDPRYGPEGAPERLNAALAQAGMGEVATLDCDEFPCLAVVILPGDPQRIVPGEHDPLLQALEAQLPGSARGYVLASAGSGDDRVRYGILALRPAEVEKAAARRLRYRTALAGVFFEADVEEAP